MPSSLVHIHELPQLPPRPRDGHKGNFGYVLVVAGARGMTGAAVLCGSSALRGGAGLVLVATPAECQAIVAAGNPCYTTTDLPADAEGRLSAAAEMPLMGLTEWADVVVMGPGLGSTIALRTLVEAMLIRCRKPMILDADAINALAGSPDILSQRSAPTILTPHPGEFARLTGATTAEVQSDRLMRSVALARRTGAIVVLKGAGTVITDGKRVYTNTTGNPGMATGGSGDVLAGLVGALVGQGMEAFAAAQLGVYLHGLSGDLAAEVLGEVALNATDLLHYFPAAFRSLKPVE